MVERGKTFPILWLLHCQRAKSKPTKLKKKKKKRLSLFTHHIGNAYEYFARGGVKNEKQGVRAPPSGRGWGGGAN